jgi:short-chain fatty acids transporter
MKFFQSFEKLMRAIFPSTFSIAIILTVFTILLALFITEPVDPAHSGNTLLKEVSTDPLSNSGNHLLQILGFWYVGLWNTSLLAFAIQMMLILVLGYVLASTKPVRALIHNALKYCDTTAHAVSLVAFFTILLSLFNWGLGLIFGAIFARKVGEHARERGIPINYPMVGAAGYSGLMVWHGGISGSAPLKVAEAGHFLSLVGKDIPEVDFGQTIFSAMNISIAIALIVSLPISLYLVGKRATASGTDALPIRANEPEKQQEKITGADRIDYSRPLAFALGAFLLGVAVVRAVLSGNFSVIDPNYLNFLLLGLGILLCGTISKFLREAKNAMGAAGGILIQFPLYFGIMGIMKYSGLVDVFSNFLMDVSNVTTFPIFTFLSAGLVNIFIPSGGGQWAVQGPIIVEAAQNLGVPMGKAIMALAYGDEITNMLQPFWALPLLGITGLQAREIIPYTVLLMVVGSVVFIAGLLLY